MFHSQHEELCFPLVCRLLERKLRISPLIEFLVRVTNPYHPFRLMFVAPHLEVIDVVQSISSFLMDDPSEMAMISVDTLTDDPDIQQEIKDLSFAVYRNEINPFQIHDILWSFIKPRTQKWFSLVMAYSLFKLRRADVSDDAKSDDELEVELFPSSIASIMCEMMEPVSLIPSKSLILPDYGRISSYSEQFTGVCTISTHIRSDPCSIPSNLIICMIESKQSRFIAHTRRDWRNGRRRLCLTKLFNTSYGFTKVVSIATDESFNFDHLHGWIHLVFECDFGCRQANPKHDRVFINGNRLDMIEVIPMSRMGDEMISVGLTNQFDDYMSLAMDESERFSVLIALLLSGNDLYGALRSPRFAAGNRTWSMLDFYVVRGFSSPEEFGFLGGKVAPHLLELGLMIIGYACDESVSQGSIRNEPIIKSRNIAIDLIC